MVKKIVLLGILLVSGAAFSGIVSFFLNREDDEDDEDDEEEMEVMEVAGGSGEQDGESGSEYDETEWTCNCPCCPDGPCCFKE